MTQDNVSAANAGDGLVSVWTLSKPSSCPLIMKSLRCYTELNHWFPQKRAFCRSQGPFQMFQVVPFGMMNVQLLYKLTALIRCFIIPHKKKKSRFSFQIPSKAVRPWEGNTCTVRTWLVYDSVVSGFFLAHSNSPPKKHTLPHLRHTNRGLDYNWI